MYLTSIKTSAEIPRKINFSTGKSEVLDSYLVVLWCSSLIHPDSRYKMCIIQLTLPERFISYCLESYVLHSLWPLKSSSILHFLLYGKDDNAAVPFSTPWINVTNSKEHFYQQPLIPSPPTWSAIVFKIQSFCHLCFLISWQLLRRFDSYCTYMQIIPTTITMTQPQQKETAEVGNLVIRAHNTERKIPKIKHLNIHGQIFFLHTFRHITKR